MKGKNSTEILVNRGGKIHYTKTELSVIKEDVVNAEEEAVFFLEQLNEIGIYNVTEARILDSSNGNKVEIVIEDGKCYVIYTDGDFYIRAIQKDNDDGEYLYMSVDD